VFHETAVGIHDALTLLGITVELKLLKKIANPVYEDKALYILIGATAVDKLPKRYSVVQMEQTTATRWITDAYKETLRGAISVWEFSEKNIAFWRSQDITTACHHVPLRIPMCFATDDVADRNVHRDIDVLFFGCRNPRRDRFFHHITHLLKPKGYNVVFSMDFDLFGDAREALIARSKIVLNLHYYSEAVLETHRIEYLLAHGKCVVSEPSTDKGLDAVYNGAIVFSAYETLADTVLRLLQ
ncbi:unnamed protein product, partial [Phaeothamnion confervicola]